MSKEETITQLKGDLAKFKEDSTKSGWESDEVDEKLAEAFEDFPWYKYKNKKRSWKSIIWNICLISLVVYMAGDAYLSRNRRLRKNINDYIFDLQIPYLHSRVLRWITIPFTKHLDLYHLFREDCLVKNPFYEKPPMRCELCENITSIHLKKANDEELGDMMLNGDLIRINDDPVCSETIVTFKDLKDLFTKHTLDMNDAICEKYLTEEYQYISDYFKLTEEEIMKKKLSIGWRNCEGYGARFYRKLFPRPSFVSNMSEVMLEKVMYILQPEFEAKINDEFPSGSTYIFQAQGESVISFHVHSDCYSSCINEPIDVKMTAGQLVVYPNEGWNVTVTGSGDRLSMIYVSAFANT